MNTNHLYRQAANLILVIAILSVSFSCVSRNDPPQPVNLKTEYLTDPLGIDDLNPRFSWQFSLTDKSYFQENYQIEVYHENELIWNANANSAGQNNITYNGDPLSPGTRYTWQVRSSPDGENWSSWSETAEFETGLLQNENWQGNWIGDGVPIPESDEDFYDIHPNPVFRKSFSASENLKSARLYITGLGYYEAYLNGTKVGDRVLEPSWTNYDKEVLYAVYDVRDLLDEENSIAVMLGNGWYNPLPLRLFRRFNLRDVLAIGAPKFLAELHIEYQDGQKETIITDTSWKTSTGEILKNNVYLGEFIDNNKLSPDWKTNGFNDENWVSAKYADPPKGQLRAQQIPPIRITDTIASRSVKNVENVYVVDMGENFAGWLHAEFPEANEGDTITFKYGELLFDDGRVNGLTTVAGHIKEMWNLSGGPGAPKTAWQLDTFIPSEDDKTFQHHFTFHGYRYVEISGLSQAPEIDNIYGLRLNSDVTTTGQFECSNALFNQIQDITLRTFKSNIFSVQSDCPGREKFGYGADIVTAAEAYLFNYDMSGFYEKTVRDFVHEHRAHGGMPQTAPSNHIEDRGFGDGSGPVGWQLAYPFVQWKLYTFYGDRQILATYYENTQRMMAHLEENAGEDHIIEIGIGDHVSIDTKNDTLTSTAFYYHNLELASRIAGALGKTDDSVMYNNKSRAVREAFISRFYNPDQHIYGDSLKQAWQVFPLYYNLIPDSDKEAIIANLEQSLADKGYHFSTGIYGTKMLFDVLREEGMSTTAFQLVNQKDYPGYGYMIENGATTLWENWQKPDHASWNHPMFGSVSEWFYRSVLGINQSEKSIGFSEILIKPGVTKELEWAKGYYNSIKGAIEVDWKNDEESLLLNVNLPPNTRAVIAVPLRSNGKVTEKEGFNSDETNTSGEISLLKTDSEFMYLEVSNGDFSFVSE